MTTMPLSQITLAPCSSDDYVPIARLQGAAFAKEEFGIVAFGPERNSEASVHAQAKALGKAAMPGETKTNTKAVLTLSDGTEEIVGFASWITCIGRCGSDEEKEKLGTKEAWAQQEKEKALRTGNKEETPFGPDGKQGSAQLREEAFLGGDKIMARLADGQDYEALCSLVVAPNFQRQGIGATLFEEVIQRANEAGLQVILGASQEGSGLYKKYGCIEHETTSFHLWEYEGGKGLGVHTNAWLRRPAVSKQRCRGV